MEPADSPWYQRAWVEMRGNVWWWIVSGGVSVAYALGASIGSKMWEVAPLQTIGFCAGLALILIGVIGMSATKARYAEARDAREHDRTCILRMVELQRACVHLLVNFPDDAHGIQAAADWREAADGLIEKARWWSGGGLGLADDIAMRVKSPVRKPRYDTHDRDPRYTDVKRFVAMRTAAQGLDEAAKLLASRAKFSLRGDCAPLDVEGAIKDSAGHVGVEKR